MTDEQIVKALGCCSDLECASCFECPYALDDGCHISDMIRDALALIKRQREEIEEQKQDIADLNETITNLLAQINTFASDIDVLTKKARAEAIREFAEQLIYGYSSGFEGDTICVQDVRELVRELTEEQK